MSVTDDCERLSPHLKYAIARNAILWKGEHQQKLKAINQDYQMKADEIWHNRTQAAREYVIDVLNQNSPTSNVRICASRDREAMQRIQELSDLYLSQPMMQKVNAKRLRESLVESSKKPKQSFFLTQQTFDNLALPSLAHTRDFRQELARGRRKDNVKSANDSFEFGPRRNVQTQQSSRPKSGFLDGVPSSDIPRPSTTSATLPIRRTSCRLSNNAKSLLELQRIQQRQRISVPSNRAPPSVSASVQGASRARQMEGGADIKPGEAGKEIQREQGNAEVDMKIKGFCERLAQSSESQQWKKYNSKWSVLREYVRSASPGVKPKMDAQPTTEANLATSTDEVSRKASVRWSDPVASVEPYNVGDATAVN